MTSYSATIRFDLSEAVGTPSEDTLVELAVLLEASEPVVSSHRCGYTVALGVEADDWSQVATEAFERVAQAAATLGLPTGPVSEVVVATVERLEQSLEESALPVLVGAVEAGAILGVSRQRVHALAAAHPGFPRPIVRTATAWLWTEDAIRAFAARWERKPGRPARKAKASLSPLETQRGKAALG